MSASDITRFEWRAGRLYVAQRHSTGRVHIVVLGLRQILEMILSGIAGSEAK